MLEEPTPIVLAKGTRRERWAMDFVHDYLTDTRRVRTLNIVDTCTRECLAIGVDLSLTAHRRARYPVLDKVLWTYGLPRAVRVDNGPEFICGALDRWAHRHGVELQFIIRNAQPSSQGRWPSWLASGERGARVLRHC